MKKIVLLSREDCYCDLITFYENVARKIPVKITDETCFDSRKISVTKSVQEVLWSYYRNEVNKTNEQISAMLLTFGPKANLKEHDILEYWVDIEEGFVSK